MRWPISQLAQDLPKDELAVMLALQPQTSGSIFEAKPTAAAWRTRPSHYIVASNDRMIAPAQEQAMAKEIKATTHTLASSHAVMASFPTEVANIIITAAG